MIKVIEEPIKSVEQFISWHLSVTEDGTRFVFRGITNDSYKLIPKISRQKGRGIDAADQIEILRRLERLDAYLDIYLPSYGIEYDQNDSRKKYWKQMIVAQHYGAPTQLLDFSKNPLVALYFAVEGQEKSDAAVYSIQIKDEYNPSGGLKNHFLGKPTPLGPNMWGYDMLIRTKSMPATCFIEPPMLDKRLSAQIGVFAYFSTEQLHNSLEEQPGFIERTEGQPGHITKFLIKSEDKEQLRGQLNRIGISRLSLFPDLGGFGDFLTWKLFSISH